MKLKSVEIRGFNKTASAKYEFSDINYIQGLNGSGKSTIIQAIQFALLGYLPNFSKQNSIIFQHMQSHSLLHHLFLHLMYLRSFHMECLFLPVF